MRKDTMLRPGADTSHRSPSSDLSSPRAPSYKHTPSCPQTNAKEAGSSQASLVRLSDVLRAHSLAGL